MLTKENYNKYITVLNEELIEAMGCTEPIAIAYGAAIARHHLGTVPDKVSIDVSGNIIKNVKSVVVPNTGGLRGIPVAAAAGIIAGDYTKKLEVISKVSSDEILEIQKFIESTPITVSLDHSECIFDIKISVFNNENSAFVRISDYHTNVVEIRKNNNTILQKASNKDNNISDRSFMNIADIIEFADTVNISDLKELLDIQINDNTAISEEGLKGNYGANIGKVLLSMYGDKDIKIRARAKAAAGSDARMNGCELPVVINSGSGNQGITSSVPVIEYAKELGVSDEKLYRALTLSNLVTIHLKTGIGRLSAYCGVISAGSGSGAGIAYLHGGTNKEISHTIVNSLGITSGIICDGAKASCAAKISTAVDAGILGYHMYKNGQQFYGGDGIIKKGIEKTIDSIGKLARDGMAGTDKEILKIMIED